MNYRCLTTGELGRFAYRGDQKAANELINRYIGADIFSEEDKELAYQEGIDEGFKDGETAARIEADEEHAEHLKQIKADLVKFANDL